MSKTGLVADTSGDIFVADTNNNRIQKCASDGSGCVRFAGVSAEAGSDNNHFNQPSGIAMDGGGNIYVGDQFNHRVQKCTSLGVCTTFAGVTGESGTDNTHFNGPSGIAVDGSGNVYVADTWNNRVQKCTSAGSCSTFAGVTGTWNDDFAHFGEPWCVTLDAQGRVYVTDNWNNRVQIFSSNGAYLTTIGGAWGIQTGEFRASWGVALDSKEDVYIGNFWDSRIQKFAPGVPGWKQANINGFGERWNDGVLAMTVFNGQLYAGTINYSDGGQAWRTSNGSTWTAVSAPGFGSAYTNTNAVVFDMIEFKGQLYAGAGGWSNDGVGGQVWRCTACDGSDWEMVEGNGFGSVDNSGIASFGVFSNTLYAATFNSGGGSEIWRSSTGNSGAWTRVVAGGNGNVNNVDSTSLTPFNGYLYAAIENSADGMEIWRTATGNEGDWDRISIGGFSDSTNNRWSGGLVDLGSNLYVGTGYDTGIARVYSSTNGTNWSQVGSDGFGDSNNTEAISLAAFNGSLYAAATNSATGVEVWRSTDGTSWNQVNIDGFGDSNNTNTTWHSSTAVFNNSLYLGTANSANGGEVWQMLNQVYLPVVLRNYDPMLYDDFNNPAFDGSYNSTLWSFSGASFFQATQQGGNLVFSNSTAPAADGADLVMLQPAQRSLQQLQQFEARLKLGSDHSGEYAFVKIQISSNNIAGHGWWTQCRLGASSGAPQFVCDVATDNGGSINFEYTSSGVTTSYDTWYTARIETDPSTAKLRFYLGGTLVGSYTPSDAAALISATNLKPSVGVWNDAANTYATRYVDDVRITQP
jgi:hypothetical protein